MGSFPLLDRARFSLSPVSSRQDPCRSHCAASSDCCKAPAGKAGSFVKVRRPGTFNPPKIALGVRKWSSHARLDFGACLRWRKSHTRRSAAAEDRDASGTLDQRECSYSVQSSLYGRWRGRRMDEVVREAYSSNRSFEETFRKRPPHDTALGN